MPSDRSQAQRHKYHAISHMQSEKVDLKEAESRMVVLGAEGMEEYARYIGQKIENFSQMRGMNLRDLWYSMSIIANTNVLYS